MDGGLPRLANGSVDYSKDFFGKPAYLTVSGQLNVSSSLLVLQGTLYDTTESPQASDGNKQGVWVL